MSAPRPFEWRLYAAIFDEEAAVKARRIYAQRRGAMRMRMTLASLALTITALVALTVIYILILLAALAYDAVVGY